MSYKFTDVGVNKISDPANVTTKVQVNFTGTNNDFIMTRSTTDTQINKNITGSTNYVGANELKTTGSPVVVSSAAPPSNGKVLTATSATTAIWKNPNSLTGLTVSGSVAVGDLVRLVPGATSAANALVKKLNNNSTWEWAAQISANGADATGNGPTLSINNNGDIFCVGTFGGSVQFNNKSSISSGTLTSSGNADIYVGNLDKYGNWQWRAKIGGLLNESDPYIITDNLGNSFITGTYLSTSLSFISSNNVTSATLTGNGSSEIFISKINNSGIFQWANKIVSISDDTAPKIAVSNTNEIYITGVWSGSTALGFYKNNAPFIGQIQLVSLMPNSIFIAKLNQSGDWSWATKIQAVSPVSGGIAFSNPMIFNDYNNCIYVTGIYTSTTTGSTFSCFNEVFSTGGSSPTNAFTFNITAKTNVPSVFISKLNSSGSFVWNGVATIATFGVNNIIQTRQPNIITDKDGNCYVCGSYSANLSSNMAFFNVDNNGLSESNADFILSNTGTASRGIYIGKLNSYGKWVWVTRILTLNPPSNGLISNSANIPIGLQIDEFNNLMISWDTYNTDTTFYDATNLLIPNSSMTLTSLGASAYLFLGKINPTGNWLWTKRTDGVFGTTLTIANQIKIDYQGNGYLSGLLYFSSNGIFGDGISLQTLIGSSNPNSYIAKLSFDDKDRNMIGIVESVSPLVVNFPGTYDANKTGLIPSFEYAIDRNGNLVPITPNEYAESKGVLQYYGTALSNTEFIKAQKHFGSHIISSSNDLLSLYPSNAFSGLIPSVLFMSHTANFSGNIATIPNAQPLFSPSAITLISNTTYIFETNFAIIRLGSGGVSRQLGLSLLGTATFTTSFNSSATIIGTTLLSTTQPVNVYSNTVPIPLTAASTTNNDFIRAFVKGIIRVTTGGTLIPSFYYTASPGGTTTALTVQANTYFMATPLGLNTLTSIGPWS